MTTIHNLTELNKLNRDLEFGDIIWFTINEEVARKYIVRRNHPNLMGDEFSDIIFHDLKINKDNKLSIATECYGYKNEPYGSYWPFHKAGDFKAVTRLVKALYEKIEDINTTPEPILSRFEILDIR